MVKTHACGCIHCLSFNKVWKKMEENSDDDLSGLFSQVASKLGWKSDKDLDVVLTELSQSTKKKKKRKETVKSHKKTSKVGGQRKTGKNNRSSDDHLTTGKHRNKDSDVQGGNKKINKCENLVYENLHVGCEVVCENEKSQSLTPKLSSSDFIEDTCIFTNTGESQKCGISIGNIQHNLADHEKVQGSDPRNDSHLKVRSNLSYEDGQNNSIGSASASVSFDSPLPRVLLFNDTPQESKQNVDQNFDAEVEEINVGLSNSEMDNENKNQKTPSKICKANSLSDSFVDSPEPIHWIMSPPHKLSKPVEFVSRLNVISDDDENDLNEEKEEAENQVEKAKDTANNVAKHLVIENTERAPAPRTPDEEALNEVPEFKVLSLTERLAQNHKEAKRRDDKKQRRRSCANPRSKQFLLDNDWADDDELERDDKGNDVEDPKEEEEEEGDRKDKTDESSDDLPNWRKQQQGEWGRDKKKGHKETDRADSFKKARNKNKDSSSDDDFESFLNAIKTSKNTRGTAAGSDDDEAEEVVMVMNDDDFIDDTPLKSESDDDDDVFYLRMINADNPLTSSKTRFSKKQHPSFGSRSGSVRGIVFPVSDDDDDDEDVFMIPKQTPSVQKPKAKGDITSKTTSKKIQSEPRRPLHTKSLSSNLANAVPSRSDTPAPVSFLRSLSTPGKGVVPRSRYVSDFKRHKDELTQRLFKLYNESVFENKLPADFSITWNNRMRKTAGFCFYKKRLGERTARIELSVKVCDSAERLRDTLIHEMCHAAAWLVHGVSDGHGKFWKYWAAKANLAHPEIPVIKRCHTYEIHTKYKYKCVQCGNVIGRHSKSIDTSRFCCALCSGRLELQPTLNKDGTPARQRGPNPFAAFVKENYASVKKTHGAAKHADVMRLLSQEFSGKAKISD